VQQVTACFECQLRDDARQPHDAETLALAWHDVTNPPPTAPWYRAMADDLAKGCHRISFDRGRPGQSRANVPFFRQIRQHIGPAPFVMPAAAAFVQDEAGRVLLQQRSDTGEWGLPGGGMELGERADQTVVHEVREETGLLVEPLRLIDVYSDDGFWYTYPHGDQVKVVSILFQCRIVGGQLQADGDESLQVRFFAPDALPPLSERHACRVRDGLALREEASP
jgi:8-oxo-dGTP pyrophosphatase MutT (NUDIX family)